MKKYKILITPHNLSGRGRIQAGKYVFEIETEDLTWSMNQYQRNRDPFRWEILEQNAD